MESDKNILNDYEADCLIKIISVQEREKCPDVLEYGIQPYFNCNVWYVLSIIKTK